MTKAITNYDKTKISMAHVFLQYDQVTMIHKYSLNHNSHWLYITFINRTYRINRKREVFSGLIMILRQFMKPIIMKQ